MDEDMCNRSRLRFLRMWGYIVGITALRPYPLEVSTDGIFLMLFH